MFSEPTREASPFASPQTLSAAWRESLLKVRNQSLEIVSPLELEDMSLQCADFVSPAKWHLAHTTWFFERMILKFYAKDFQTFDPTFDYLFNSYYETAGKFHARHLRGQASRPLVREVLKYRKHVEERLANEFLSEKELSQSDEIFKRIELGIQHELQHQELMLMDIKYNFFSQPTPLPYLHQKIDLSTQKPDREKWSFSIFDEGFFFYGADSTQGFCYDNETPGSKTWLPGFQLANQLVSNAEYLDFIHDGGYQRPELWLSDGWAWRCRTQATHPLYWTKEFDEFWSFQLSGKEPLVLQEPVSHVNFYEAAAYARWASARLPAEWEWERAAREQQCVVSRDHDFMHLQSLRPKFYSDPFNGELQQMHGQVWQWTSSDYAAYPGYRPYENELSEYNSKFMCNQKVLRGGSCLTPIEQYRPTYRNFFYPDQAWACTGIRLAKDFS